MPEISRHQKQYLLQYKKEKHLIFTARILLFVLLMGLWEMSARCGWIDSFIFSSPSLIGKTFLSMCRNSCQFLFCCNPGRGNCHSSLVFSKDF